MPKLAINGGNPEALELIEKIPPWPQYDEDDKKALLAVLESRKWCRLYKGSKAEQFENEFAKFHQAKYGIAVANGTVSLELILKTLGITLGDEVIVPALTFIATASAVVEVGGIPIMADINPDTATIDPKSVEQLITTKTKAIIGVHYSGYPIDFDSLIPLTKKYDLYLIEDAAHAHGAEWKGRKIGAIGHMGSFSFQESKTLTAGEGGIVLTNDKQLYEKAMLLHNIGRVIGRPGYEHYTLSSNYRLSELQAALLLSRLKKFPKELERRNEGGKYLATKLKKIGGVEPLKEDDRVTKLGYYFFVIRYNKEEFNNTPKEKFIKALNAEGVPAGVMYEYPLYKQPAFKRENLLKVLPEELVERMPNYEKLHLPNTEKYLEQEIILSHPILQLDKEYLDLIIAAVEKIRTHVEELSYVK